jgi:regulator of protease activity HflC (stomatin/prohibitin superfamily)
MGFLVLVILAALVAVVAFVTAFTAKAPDTKRAGGIVGGVAVACAVVFLIWGSLMTVPYGHIGVMSRFGRVTGEVKQNGLSWKALIDTPIILSIQTQKDEVPNEAASKDLQDVKTVIAVNYRIDSERAPEILRTIGTNYWAVFAAPAEQEIVKAIAAKYNAEDMILRREEVKQDITDALTKRLAERGIIAEAINITNFEFSAEFTAAIEAKVVAAQNVAQAENKLKQIEVEARQAVAKAEGDANAAVSRAEGQAKANAIIQESLTPEILQYFLLDKLGQNVQIMVIPGSQGLTLQVPDITGGQGQ